ncbi:cutinase family protein [Nocardia wallacei]|uniref:cutinase family protein n=1 Tax=Nocardia wallacei TaxID=480035 RepID=UPI0024581592|nr:cutinase family protein [Nocardia wallacei]
MSARRLRTRAAAGLLTGLVVGVVVSGPAAAAPPPADAGCPVLWVLAVQGTGQSSPAASRTDDTGVLGALLGPVTVAAPAVVQHTYIPYQAGFGGLPGAGGGPESYAASVAEAVAELAGTAEQVVDRCPATMLAMVGYSQGAQVVSQVARAVGAGNGPVPADRVAAIALYANPERRAGTQAFPGRPGQQTPDPAPGSSGSAVAMVQIPSAPASGGGIADDGAEYGALTGRVADICVDGDLACSAPEHAALLRVGALLAARADLSNPLAALASLQQALSAALGSAWTTFVLDDIQVGPATVDYTPQAPLAQRLIEAADPRVPAPGPERAEEAADRWNQITVTVTANPGEVVKLAGQLSAAWGQLAADNADLADPAVWARMAATAVFHQGYAATGQLASGIAWLVALAHDLSGGSR